MRLNSVAQPRHEQSLCSKEIWIKRNHKRTGVVVDYVGVFDNLTKALNFDNKRFAAAVWRPTCGAGRSAWSIAASTSASSPRVHHQFVEPIW